MELYFLRHAIAAEPGEIKVSSDAERPLVSEGIKKMKKGAEAMKKMGLEFDEIVASPYLRAKETAEIVIQEMGLKQKLRFSDALVPNAAFKDFLKFLVSFPPKSRLLLVGHQPSVGDFISMLISGRSDAALDIKKGSLTLVEATPNGQEIHGELKWMLAPKQLREVV